MLAACRRQESSAAKTWALIYIYNYPPSHLPLIPIKPVRFMHSEEKPPVDEAYNPYQASLTAKALPAANHGAPELASLGQRFAAACIDFGIFLLLSIGIVSIASQTNFTPYNLPLNDQIVQASGFFAILVYIIVQLVSIANSAQSLGKRALKIQVVRKDTLFPCNTSRYVWLRWALPTAIYCIPLIGLFFMLLDNLLVFAADRRCLHDKIADTLVVKV